MEEEIGVGDDSVLSSEIDAGVFVGSTPSITAPGVTCSVAGASAFISAFGVEADVFSVVGADIVLLSSVSG